jgi:hypothetical protein
LFSRQEGENLSGEEGLCGFKGGELGSKWDEREVNSMLIEVRGEID